MRFLRRQAACAVRRAMRRQIPPRPHSGGGAKAWLENNDAASAVTFLWCASAVCVYALRPLAGLQACTLPCFFSGGGLVHGPTDRDGCSGCEQASMQLCVPWQGTRDDVPSRCGSSCCILRLAQCI
jgi:hypothetical protein